MFNKMTDVSERFSDTQDKPEASDIQVITHNNNNNNNSNNLGGNFVNRISH